MEKQKNVPTLRFSEFDGEWEIKKLGEVGEVKMCRRIFNEETSPIGEIPFFKIGSFGKEPDAFITKELYLEYRQKFSFPKKGHILISAAGTIGRLVVYNGEDAYYQDSNIVWIDNDSASVSNEFLFFILQIVKYNTEGGTIQRLYNSILKSTKFCCPPPPEQQKIASFFTAIDQKISQLKRKKTLLEQYKKGVMQKIFSQQIRFKDDNGQEFPRWEKKKLGEIGEVITGKTPSTKDSDLWNGEIQFVTPTDINENKYQWNTERKIKKLPKTRILPSKSIMFTCIASIGKMSLSINPCVTNQQINSIIPNADFDNEFVYYSLLNIVDFIKSTQSTNTLPIINKTEFSKFIIFYPILPEQTRIAGFLSAVDEKINHTQKQIEKAELWKKGLMQKMFV